MYIYRHVYIHIHIFTTQSKFGISNKHMAVNPKLNEAMSSVGQQAVMVMCMALCRLSGAQEGTNSKGNRIDIYIYIYIYTYT